MVLCLGSSCHGGLEGSCCWQGYWRDGGGNGYRTRVCRGSATVNRYPNVRTPFPIVASQTDVFEVEVASAALPKQRAGDSILHHILAGPGDGAWQAIRTAIVCTRWRRKQPSVAFDSIWVTRPG